MVSIFFCVLTFIYIVTLIYIKIKFLNSEFSEKILCFNLSKFKIVAIVFVENLNIIMFLVAED